MVHRSNGEIQRATKESELYGGYVLPGLRL
jgi:hypothetical protein